MTEKPIEITEKDIVLVCTEMNGDYLGISTDDFDFENTKQKILQALQEYPKLKESCQERVNTANKIISEKIDKIKKLKAENEGYQYVIRYDNEQYGLLRQEINQLKQLKQIISEIDWDIVEKAFDNDNFHMMGCDNQETYQQIQKLQQLLKDEKQ